MVVVVVGLEEDDDIPLVSGHEMGDVVLDRCLPLYIQIMKQGVVLRTIVEVTDELMD